METAVWRVSPQPRFPQQATYQEKFRSYPLAELKLALQRFSYKLATMFC